MGNIAAPELSCCNGTSTDKHEAFDGDYESMISVMSVMSMISTEGHFDFKHEAFDDEHNENDDGDEIQLPACCINSTCLCPTRPARKNQQVSEAKAADN